MDNHIFVFGEIGFDVTLESVRQQIEPNAKAITLHINSPGGIVDEGFAIHDYLISQNKHIMTIVEGSCYSIATVVALAGAVRLMQPNSKWMVHNPWGGASGDAGELKKAADMLASEQTRLAKFYASKLGITETEAVALMADTTFFDYEKAKKIGFVSGLVEAFKAVAKLNINSTNNTKMELAEKDKNFISGLFADMQKMFAKHRVKAMLTLAVIGADGKETAIYVDGDAGDIVGKKAYTDEAMAKPLATGDHQMKDGRTLTVGDGGEIKAVKEASEDKALADTKAALKAEKELTAKKDEEIKALKADMAELGKNMLEIKAMVIGGDKAHNGKPAPVGASGKGESFRKSPQMAKVYADFGAKFSKQ